LVCVLQRQLSYALYASLLPHFKSGTFSPVLVDYALTVVPLLLGVTVLAQRPWTLLAMLATGTLALTISRKPAVKGERDESRRRRELREDVSSDEDDREEDEDKTDGQPKSPIDDKTRSPSSNSTPPQAFLTIYRAHMMTITVLAILAVDFPVFPRGFGKTELWGASLVSAEPSLRRSSVIN
jgi:hypothetical protein